MSNNAQEEAWMHQLDEIIAQKNRITIDEFAQYAPLFERPEGMPELDKHNPAYVAMEAEAYVSNLSDLGAEWANRINLYEKVHIIDHAGEVIRTIPPGLCRPKTLNEVVPGVSGEIIDSYGNAVARSTPVRDLSARHTQTIRKVIQASISDEEKEKIQTEYKEMEKEAIASKEHNSENAVDGHVDEDAWE